jgi:hypothetical protein
MNPDKRAQDKMRDAPTAAPDFSQYPRQRFHQGMAAVLEPVTASLEHAVVRSHWPASPHVAQLLVEKLLTPFGNLVKVGYT